MRSVRLNYLFSSIVKLKGVGEKSFKVLERLVGGGRVVDLLYHKPSAIVDRRYGPALSNAQNGEVITVRVLVEAHLPPERRGRPFKVRCYNENGYLTVVFFNIYKDYIARNFAVGKEIAVSGRVDRYGGELQMVHPHYVTTGDKIASLKFVERVYPMAAGIAPKLILEAMGEALGKLPNLGEWIDGEMMKRQGWKSWKESMRDVHNPKCEDDLLYESVCCRRLAYDELLASQLAMGIVRMKGDSAEGKMVKGDNSLCARYSEGLDFELTCGQKKVLREIFSDMRSGKRMMRLLQGDVGSGKTVVALLCMLNAVEAGKQAVLLAPTYILAMQHYEKVRDLADRLGLKAGLLTGKSKVKERKEILDGLESGKINVLVGTHALFQKQVEFKDLALVVIDEQHRFGVEQRLSLIEKGDQADVLLMSATPIPRSLMLSVYGDMEISILDEKPVNRKNIDTRIMSLRKLDLVRDAVGRAIKGGDKVYWVCPLVEESQNSAMTSAQDRFLEFKKIFGSDAVGLIHGRMKAAQKDKVMEEFADARDKMRILVATTVVEVGVDVPEACVMVIEHSEHFGLSQLHQLRGRVGRSDKQSYCMLLYGGNVSQNCVKRLEVMRNSNDGFEIAEEDLKMRGGGEIMGVKQSGLPEYRMANLMYHYDLVNAAAKQAKIILNKNPELKGKDGEIIRDLLHLFDYDACLNGSSNSWSG